MTPKEELKKMVSRKRTFRLGIVTGFFIALILLSFSRIEPYIDIITTISVWPGLAWGIYLAWYKNKLKKIKKKLGGS